MEIHATYDDSHRNTPPKACHTKVEALDKFPVIASTPVAKEVFARASTDDLPVNGQER